MTTNTVDHLLEHVSKQQLPRSFLPGEILLQEGDVRPGMLVLKSGTVKMSRTLPNGKILEVGILEAPTVVGELSLFTGEGRAATVTAVTAVEAFDANTRDLLKLSEDNDPSFDDFSGEMARRLIESRLSRLVRSAFAISDPALLDAVVHRMELRTLEPGQVLFEKSAEADSMAVLLEGRLEVRDPEQAKVLLGLIFPGESVGEQGLLGQGQHRTARVSALRQATLAILSRADFEALLLPHIDIVLSLFRRVLDRIQNRYRALPNHGTVLFLVPDETLLRPLRDALNLSHRTGAVGNREAFDHFQSKAILDLRPDHPMTSLLGAWIGSLESENPTLVLYGDEASPGWNSVAQKHSDLVIRLTPRTSLQSSVYHLVTKSGGALRGLPRLPGVWDANDSDSTDRMSRLLQRKGRGLVLSGGGARGFAHLGVLQALLERGMAPDSIGGTSMGALVGSMWALHRDFDVLKETAKEFGKTTKILDWTIPSASLVRSRKLGRILRGLFGTKTFGDLALPFFCIATDLRAAKEVVFDEGPLFDAVRASLSIPGIFYPVVRGSNLLVDGGVMNNYPVDIMADRLGGGFLMGSNVGLMSTHSERKLYQAPHDHLSGLQRLYLSKFRPKSGEIPAIADILMRTFDVNTARRQDENKTPIDLAFEIDVSRFDPLDFGKHRSIIDEGYRQATLLLDR